MTPENRETISGVDKLAMKTAVKEAIKEWLDERWTAFSGNFTKWILALIGGALLAALLVLALTANGWKPPQ